MKKFNYRSIIFMIVITVLFTSVLATINELTENQIYVNQELKEQKSLLYVLNIPFQDKTALEVSNIYSTQIKTVQRDGFTYYEAYENDSLIGYIFPMEGDAVWGSLRGYISLTPELDQILGVDFLSHSETPGLGGRIDELQFKEQFRRIKVNLSQTDDNYIVYRPNPGGQVDAVSGATGTSKAVRNIINQNLKSIFTIMEGGLSND